jgi:uncharacterized damage-inducible protein DinB
MSTNQEFYAQASANEVPAFIRVLEALPESRFDYKPHEKNTAAGDLAWQLAIEQRCLCELLDSGVINYEQGEAPAKDEIIGAFQKASDDLKEKLAAVDDAKWGSKGDFRMGGQSVWSGTVQELAWGFLFDMIHHRGQLSAYIRPMGGKVPSIYGPTADDSGTA